jgi:hypothetical protein
MVTKHYYGYLSRIYAGIYYLSVLDFYNKLSEFNRGFLKYESKDFQSFKKYFDTAENIPIIMTTFSLNINYGEIFSTPFDLFEKELIVNFCFFFFKKYHNAIEIDDEKELFLELENIFRDSKYCQDVLYFEIQNTYKFLNENKKITEKIKHSGLGEFKSKLTDDLKNFYCLNYFYEKNIFTIETTVVRKINFYLEIIRELNKNS